MGTNHYLYKPDGTEMHIGKSSYGWCFALHVETEGDFPRNLEDWIELFRDPENVMMDEYQSPVSTTEMLMTIMARKGPSDFTEDYPQKDPFYKSWEDFHHLNHSEPGPEGLCRARIGEGHCVGHGEGTWDLITGEFC